MLKAVEYRAKAAEHHRLATLCRLPESREQHYRLEQHFLALADSEERSREAQPADGGDGVPSSPV